MRTVALLFFLLFLLLAAIPAAAQIDVYFNRSVDTTLAYPPGNIARGAQDFSLIALQELTRAKRSVDMAMYNLNVPRVVDGLIAASRRGVKVRVVAHVENVDEANSRFRQLIAAGIPVVANPIGPAGDPQPLMHNKFFVIDGRAGAPDDALPTVITGSWNATAQQTSSDPNNLVMIRDPAVAAAYLTEFEEMWGSSADAPDTVAARFGAAKRSNTVKSFTLRDSTRIEVRFSPSDSTAQRINTYLASGQTSIYTANLTFTYSLFANTLRLQRTRGADVRSIVDNVDDQGSQFNFLKSFAEAYDWRLGDIFHHKYAVVDALPHGTGSLPLVVTGSHNWTHSAETRNDENTVVIFSATIANQFLQEFAARYKEVGGTTPFRAVTGVYSAHREAAGVRVYPNPFGAAAAIAPVLGQGERGVVVLADALGRQCGRWEVGPERPIVHLSADGLANGLYMVTFTASGRAGSVAIVVAR